MRMLALTAVLAALVGCGQKPNPGPPAPSPAPAPVNEPPGQPTTITSPKKWESYSSPQYGFKAAYPWGTPVTWPMPLADPPPSEVADTVALSINLPSKDNKMLFAYAFTIVPVRFKNGITSAVREGVMREIFEYYSGPKTIYTQGMTRKSEKAITWGGVSGQEVLFESDGPAEAKKSRVIFRQIITDTVGYIGFVRDDGELTPPEIAKFLDSFELLSKPNSK